jgi:hypothetical protein
LVVGSFHELACLEGGAGADQGDEVGPSTPAGTSSVSHAAAAAASVVIGYHGDPRVPAGKQLFEGDPAAVVRPRSGVVSGLGEHVEPDERDRRGGGQPRDAPGGRQDPGGQCGEVHRVGPARHELAVENGAAGQ